jgi:hypothetical protein
MRELADGKESSEQSMPLSSTGSDEYKGYQYQSLEMENELNGHSVGLDFDDDNSNSINEMKRPTPLSFAGVDNSSQATSFIGSALQKLPGLIIAITLNLFLSVSFGPALFPASMDFPKGIPSSIGVQMWLFSTLTSQIVMTSQSDFPAAMGMMMVRL